MFVSRFVRSIDWYLLAITLILALWVFCRSIALRMARNGTTPGGNRLSSSLWVSF